MLCSWIRFRNFLVMDSIAILAKSKRDIPLLCLLVELEFDFRSGSPIEGEVSMTKATIMVSCHVDVLDVGCWMLGVVK